MRAHTHTHTHTNTLSLALYIYTQQSLVIRFSWDVSALVKTVHKIH
jgi:hypothetical protein